MYRGSVGVFAERYVRQAPVKLTVEVRCSAPGYSSYYVTTLQPTSYHCISVTMTMFSIVALCVLCQTANAIKTHFVFWNTTNPIFRLDNTDNVIDVNVGNLPWEYDQLNLICPQNSPEQHVIYSVSQEDFQSCRVNDQRPKIVAICNKPSTFQYFTITFRNFSPTPGGLEFKPGQNYYFISTSTQRDIHRRAGGFCSSHNMKMIFKVADNQESNSVNSEENIGATEMTEAASDEGAETRSSPFLRAVSPTVSSHRPTLSYPTTSLSSRPSSSMPIYYYRSRTSDASKPKEYNYYYSPRDLLKLRKAILARTQENETLKAEKLLSSSGVSVTLSYLVFFTVNCWMFLRWAQLSASHQHYSFLEKSHYSCTLRCIIPTHIFC